jgi:hypothetical protein
MHWCRERKQVERELQHYDHHARTAKDIKEQNEINSETACGAEKEGKGIILCGVLEFNSKYFPYVDSGSSSFSKAKASSIAE